MNMRKVNFRCLTSAGGTFSRELERVFGGYCLFLEDFYDKNREFVLLVI